MKHLIGIDIFEPKRMKDALKRKGFLERVFHKNELKYLKKVKDPVGFYALLFCVKEAFLKAMGLGWNQFTKFNDIDVSITKNRPKLCVSGRTLKMLKKMKVKKIHADYSRTTNYILALVVLER